MKKQNRKKFLTAWGLFTAFAVWTALVSLIDVQFIGPQGSKVGFATFNKWIHDAVGVNWWLYSITDWLGLVPIGFCFGFAILGLIQWIKRRNFLKVDRGILVLGGYYIAVMIIYGFFEMVVINYRPVLIDGCLEASYPSSTTMLVLCVMPTAVMQLNARIQIRKFRRCVSILISAFVIFMVIGRLLSGVHWITDIIGGILLSAGLVRLYVAIINYKR